MTQSTWQQRVKTAQALTDLLAKRDAFISLLQEALPAYSLYIVPAKPMGGYVRPNFYQPVPVINFDFFLSTRRFATREGRKGIISDQNTGYFFASKGVGYATLSPQAIESYTPLLTQMHADHELFHAHHHCIPTLPYPDRETQAWLDAFLHYFHRLYPIVRKHWQPLTDNFEKAQATTQQTTIEQLNHYYQSQSANIQAQLQQWWRVQNKRNAGKQLIHQLNWS